jgi:PRTRC genetic system protein A
MKKIGIHTYSWLLSDLVESGLQPFNIVAGNDGQLYEIRHSELGTIIIPAVNLRRLEEIPRGFQFNLPKIPGVLLAEAVSFFRDYCQNGIELEVMVSFFYHPGTKQYVIDCPVQTVSKGRIDFEELSYEREGYIEILQLHSHNTMEAYFSSVDNNDEKRFLLYGVIGQLNHERPAMKLRAGVNGYFYDLPLDYIFHEPNLNLSVDYPMSWHDNVAINF